MLQTYRKTYRGGLEIKDASKGEAHLIVSVFGNEDSDRDVVMKGSFLTSIKEGKKHDDLPPGVWSHDLKSPVAKTVDAYEDDEGLHVLANFNMKTQRGSETFYDIEAGIVKKYSFGFSHVTAERKNGVRYISDLKWHEWSPVLIPANVQTRTVDTKGQYLGEYVEGSMTLAAVRSAVDALFYNVMYDAVYNYDGESSLHDRIEMVRGGLSELSGLVLGVCQALLREGNTKEAAQQLHDLFQRPGTKGLILHDGMTYEDQIAVVLAAAEMVENRGGSIKSLREADGRDISGERVEQLKGLHAKLEKVSLGLKGLCESPADAAPATTNAAQQAYLRFMATDLNLPHITF